MEPGNTRAHRWRVQAGAQASRSGIEISRSPSRGGIRLILLLDDSTRISVLMSRCRPVAFVVGDRVIIRDRSITGQVSEISGHTLWVSVPCTRFPDCPRYAVSESECDPVETH